VRDVFRLQRLNGLDLAARGLADLLAHVCNEFSIDGSRLDDAGPDSVTEHLLAKRLRERSGTELGEAVDASTGPGDAACRRADRHEVRNPSR
jgi:hypothetical protein